MVRYCSVSVLSKFQCIYDILCETVYAPSHNCKRKRLQQEEASESNLNSKKVVALTFGCCLVSCCPPVVKII